MLNMTEIVSIRLVNLMHHLDEVRPSVFTSAKLPRSQINTNQLERPVQRGLLELHKFVEQILQLSEFIVFVLAHKAVYSAVRFV